MPAQRERKVPEGLSRLRRSVDASAASADFTGGRLLHLPTPDSADADAEQVQAAVPTAPEPVPTQADAAPVANSEVVKVPAQAPGAVAAADEGAAAGESGPS